MKNSIHHIEEKLHLFKVSALKVKILKGSLLWLTILIGLILVTSLTEWVGELSVFNRTILAVLFLLFSFISCIILIIKPILQLLRANKSITDKEAALVIGKFFPLIGDKLLNYLELSKESTDTNTLIYASLNQRAHTLEPIGFNDAIDNSTSKKPIWVLIPLVMITGVLLVVFPQSFIASSDRVINFRTEYIPEAPFNFTISSNQTAYKNEDYNLQVNLTGNTLPTELYLVEGKSKVKLANAGIGSFNLIFPKLQLTKSFHLEAAGYNSQTFIIKIIERPSMNSLSANVRYPNYLHKTNETIKPAGKLELPEGTIVNWTLNTQYSDQAIFYYNNDSSSIKIIDNNVVKVQKPILESGFYGFKLSAGIAIQKGKIEYSIKSIKDEFPTLSIQSFTDTLLYNTISIGGEVSDDYGISNLQLVYSINDEANHTLAIPFNRSSANQQIYTNWILDSLNLLPGEELSYYIQVSDNDGINGIKSTKSQLMFLKVPTKIELNDKLDKASETEKGSINQAHKKSEDLMKKLNETLENIKSKKELSWEDKQNIKELLKEKKKLTEKIEDLKKQNELLQRQREELQSPSPELEEKAEQLQNLMNELLDEETRELYEELKKLLEEQAEADKVQSLLNDIKNNEVNLEEELERTLELFKRLEVEQNLEKLSQDLNELSNRQDSLAENTIDKNNNTEDLKESQEEIEKEFDNLKEQLEQTKEKNNDLKSPSSFEDTSGEEEEIKKEINESKENLDKNNRKKSSQNQENSGKKMRDLGEKLDKMQGSMQMEQMQEDINNLRSILENLITLSYNQEEVMVDFKAINQSNPQFITLSEDQLKIKDDSKIIKDSLMALANRVMAISSFVTRELNEMDTQLDKSAVAIKDRKKSEASKYQQLSMTSMNNLALMLDNVLEQMQQSMADAMGKGKGEKNQPIPGMSELQEQLNKEIRELQQSGKSGKELSQELAKLAAEQEMIRKALREAEEKLGQKPGDKNGNQPGNLGKLQKQMEQTELDLVNKNLSRDLQRRQQQILTRLLEAEKAMREQEMELKRKSKSAVQYEKELPRSFEEYLKQKEKEIELIKTIPPKLHPYYKKEVNEYFNRLKKIDN